MSELFSKQLLALATDAGTLSELVLAPPSDSARENLGRISSGVEAIRVLFEANVERMKDAMMRGNWEAGRGSCDEETLVYLVALLGDSSADVRRIATKTLAGDQLAHPGAIPVLVALLSGEETELRACAAESIRGFGVLAKDAIPALCIAVRDEDPGVGFCAIAALKEIDAEGDRAIPVLIEALSASEVLVRRGAAAALPEWGEKAANATDKFLELLEGADLRLRCTLIGGLPSLGKGNAKAKAVVSCYLDDLDGEVRNYAAYALRLYEKPD